MKAFDHISMDPLRIGILGAAGIVRNKNWQAIRCSGNCEVAAVATRDLQKTRAFITEMQAALPFPTTPQAHAGYDELLADPSIEAVYLPLPTALRKPWVLRAARAGKHVICEKPCAVNAQDLREMLDACREHRVQFMDGVMFMHSPRLGRLRALMDDPEKFGTTHRITSAFSFLAPDDFQRSNIRANSALEPLGCLGDLGWYCIRFSLWAMDWQMPLRVRGTILSDGDGPPMNFSGEMLFAGGVSAAFHCSFGASFQQWVHLSGSQGYVRVPDFVLPSADNDIAWEVNHRPVPKVETGLHLGPPTTADSQEARMFRHFAAQVRSGILEEAWFKEASLTQQVTDACFASAMSGGAWRDPAGCHGPSSTR